MKERGIIFSGPMVRALLDGRKTMTRRSCKKAWDGYAWAGSVHPAREEGWISWWPGSPTFCTAEFTKQQYRKGWLCPYGVPGDRLWVRESFNGASYGHPVTRPDEPSGTIIRYYANERHADFPNKFLSGQQGKKRPSIHMPRWASRITLEIVGVRVERLNDIYESDAIAEGVDKPEAYGCKYRDSFTALWESIHGPGSWEQNPWVWVIEFKKI